MHWLEHQYNAFIYRVVFWYSWHLHIVNKLFNMHNSSQSIWSRPFMLRRVNYNSVSAFIFQSTTAVSRRMRLVWSTGVFCHSQEILRFWRSSKVLCLRYKFVFFFSFDYTVLKFVHHFLGIYAKPIHLRIDKLN